MTDGGSEAPITFIGGRMEDIIPPLCCSVSTAKAGEAAGPWCNPDCGCVSVSTVHVLCQYRSLVSKQKLSPL